MDAKDFEKCLATFSDGWGRVDDARIMLWQFRDGRDYYLNDYGRDVLEVLRLGLAVREQQAVEPTLQEIAARAAQAATALHETFHTTTGHKLGAQATVPDQYVHSGSDGGEWTTAPARLETPPCPKCGGDTGPKWHGGSAGYMALHWTGETLGCKSHMRANCQTCGYSWAISSLDEFDKEA
jgi:hypothetical protein